MTHPFVTLTQAAHPARVFEDPVLLDGELARRGTGPIPISDETGESSLFDLPALCVADEHTRAFDGWADLADWTNLLDQLEQWAPHLAGFITCKTQQQRIIFHDGNATVVDGQVVYPDSAGDEHQVLGPGGNGVPLAAFDFAGWNDCGTRWEIVDPGEDPEQTWQDGAHDAATLTEAVQAILPEHAAYGLTLPSAAKLLLQLELIRGTGAATASEK